MPSVSEGCNRTGKGAEMGSEGDDQRERKHLQCREWVSRVELCGKGMIKQECDKH